jgi:hypothetical protein
VCDWDDEEGVAAVGDTREGIVPGCEGGEDSKCTSSLNAGGVWCAGAVLEVTDSEHEEGEVEGEEQEEEGDGGAECADKEDGGEDEPALFVRY